MTEKQLHQRAKLITFAALTVIFLLLIYIIIQWITLSKANLDSANINKEKQTLTKQIEVLEQELERKKSRAYIEQYAREKLGYGYAGEKKYIIKDKE